MADFRALCAELVDDLELCDWPYKLSETIRADINRARAALAEPQPEEPTDEELYDYWISTSPEFGCADPIGFARAVLARWGNPAPLPLAEGEVAGLVVQLREMAVALDNDWYHTSARLMREAAELLQRQASNPWKDTLLDALVCNFLLNSENKDDPKKALSDLIAWEKQLATDPLINPALQPVPISERLPEPEDCDAEHYCWRWNTIGGLWARQPLARKWYEFESHWLPYFSLPLPCQK